VSSSAILGNRPLITYALVAAMLVTFGVTHFAMGEGSKASAAALERAREFYEQNPQVEVSPRDRQLLGQSFVDVIADSYERERASGGGPLFSARMQQRTQDRFDAIADAAFTKRLEELAAWRFGVGGAGTPAQNHVLHIFAHEGPLALAVSLVFLVILGIGLEAAWGPLLFGGFVLLGTVAPAIAFRAVDSASGIPLSGASGLVSALLGAYLIRSLGGGFALPGWLLIPVWGFVEYLFVRQIWIDSTDSAPFVTHGVGLAVGAGFAAIVRVLNIERKLVDWADNDEDSEQNPALSAAEQAVDRGDSVAAFDLLRTAHAESPGDTDVSRALWELAREHGRGEEAITAILPLIRGHVRAGEMDGAAAYWNQLIIACPNADVESTLCVRMGEGLLDEGQPDAATDALRRAVDHPAGLPTAMAQRVVRVARDLDPDLTQRAAAIALQDRTLDDRTRASLESLAAEVRTASASTLEAPGAGPPVHAPAPSTTHEITDYPADSDIDLQNVGELTDAAEFEELNLGSAPDGRHVEADPEEIDPNALSIQSIERQFSGELGLEEGEELTDPDVESWNDPGMLSGDALAAEPSEAAVPAAPPAPAESEAPLASSAPIAPPATTEPSPLGSPQPAGGSQKVFASPSPSETAPLDPATIDTATDMLEDELDIGNGLRTLKRVEAVPLGLKDNSLEIEIEGRGASKIPFDRIDAVAIAAVSGISAKPVLIIDVALNWMDTPDMPLKVIRMHSNAFNPMRLMPAAPSALEAIKAFAATLIERSGATPLPDPGAVAGSPFASFPSCAEYEQVVLGATD
jgi:membrane associated rhomboid family serine protease